MLMATRRPRRCLIWTPALLLALLGCGSERSAPPGTTTPEAEAAVPHVAPEALPEPGPASAEGETLLLQPPPAWLRVTEQINDKLRLVEYLPAGHDEGNWNDRLIVESNELDPLPDPIQFLKALGDDLRTQCTESDHRNLSSGLENGYPTSVRMLMCRKENTSGRGRISFVKAIQGNEAFYVISRTRRSDPLDTETAPMTAEETAAMALYMRSIKVCDTRKEAHPCPASDAGKEPTAG